MSSPEYAGRKHRTVPAPIIILIGAFAGWLGFSNQSMDQIQIPEITQAIVTDLEQRISEDITEVREEMARHFNN